MSAQTQAQAPPKLPEELSLTWNIHHSGLSVWGPKATNQFTALTHLPPGLGYSPSQPTWPEGKSGKTLGEGKGNWGRGVLKENPFLPLQDPLNLASQRNQG